MITNMLRYALVLGVICIVSGGGIALTYNRTKDKIGQMKREKLLSAVEAVLPDAVKIAEERIPDGTVVRIGRDEQGKIVGYAAQGEARGYSSTIEVIVGARREKGVLLITRARIVAQAETPGLGTKAAECKLRLKNDTEAKFMLLDQLAGRESVDGPGHMDQFAGLSEKLFLRENLTRTLAAEGKVDILSGATITTNAVNQAVGKALERIRVYVDKKK